MFTQPERIAFDESELEVTGIQPESLHMCEVEEFSFPISSSVNAHAALMGHPLWQMVGYETLPFNPRCVPDNIARGYVRDATPFDPVEEGGGKDMFGIEWIFDANARGSMEDPKQGYVLADISDWRDVIVFPDVDSWDWERSAAENNGTYLTTKTLNESWIFTGWFERLISFMGFEEAAVTLVDEDDREEAAALFMKLSDVYVDIIDHYVKYFEHIDSFLIHDDWGSAAGALFSPEACEAAIVPAMRKVTDRLHEYGIVANLHSCGNGIKQVPNMIKAGWDSWTPQGNVNDTADIYDRYGDQIVIAVSPEIFDPETTSEEEQRAYARAYVERYCKPGKPSIFNFRNQSGKILTHAYNEELYKASRRAYCG
jgi:hypothetical protein